MSSVRRPASRHGRRPAVVVFAGVVALLVGCASEAPAEVAGRAARFAEVADLPPPELDGDRSLERTLGERRSTREYADEPLTSADIGQLLWAGQGVTDERGRRTAPSAGARYPLELYALTDGLLMHYLPEGHRVERRTDTTTLDALAENAFGQEFVARAPLVIVVAADPSRTEREYGAVAERLVDREAGHAAQNVLLQATALDLAAVPVGGFDPAAVARLLALPPGQDVRYLIPIGHPAD